MSTYNLQTAASANGNGTPASPLQGGSGITQFVEITETNGGTATVTLQGSIDGGTNWYAVGYQQIDATATPARAVTDISVTANSAHAYQILDRYPQLRAVVSAVATSPSVNVRLVVMP